jgi:hypothetical protein
MAAHFLDSGVVLQVHNRTASHADGLLAREAIWCASPAALAAPSTSTSGHDPCSKSFRRPLNGSATSAAPRS